MSRPLVVTSEPACRDALARLAAAAGADVDVVADPAAARRAWREAPLVLVGADCADAVALSRPPRRPGVVLIGDDLDDGGVWQRAVELGAENVVFLPDAEAWLVDRLAATAQTGSIGMVLGVVGGRGGAGASTLATALAVTATRLGRAAVLVDADPLGGGVDLLLGAEDVGGARWGELARAADRALVNGLVGLVPTVHRIAVVSCGRGGDVCLADGVATRVVRAARRDVDVVIVDVGRRFDESTAEVLQLLDSALLVVPADVRGVAASACTATALAAYVDDIGVVVRRSTSGGVEPRFAASALGLPLLAHLRSERGVPLDADRGLPPAGSGRGHLARACTTLVRELLPARPGRPSAAA